MRGIGMDIQKLPLKNLIRKPARTAALIILTALLAVAVFGGSVFVLSLKNGLASLESRLGADIIVVPSSAQSKVSFKNMLLQGTTGAFYMDGDNLERTKEVDGVEAAAPQIFLSSLKADCCSVKIQVIGFDPETDFTVKPWIEKSTSRSPGLMDVVVGTDVEADVGETLRIYDENCHVTGRLAATGTGLDTAVYCSLETMKCLLEAAEKKGISHKIESDDEDVVSAIYVKVREGADIGKVNSAIQGHTRNASAVKTKSMITDVSSSLAGVSSAVSILIGAVWGLSLVILIAAFVMIAHERKKEFALLRVLGTSRRMLGRIVLKESAMCSFAGGILGVLLTSAILFPFTTLIEMKLGLPYLRPSAGTIIALAAASVALTAAAGSVSSLYASHRLSGVDPGTVYREG